MFSRYAGSPHHCREGPGSGNPGFPVVPILRDRYSPPMGDSPGSLRCPRTTVSDDGRSG